MRRFNLLWIKCSLTENLKILGTLRARMRAASLKNQVIFLLHLCYIYDLKMLTISCCKYIEHSPKSTYSRWMYIIWTYGHIALWSCYNYRWRKSNVKSLSCMEVKWHGGSGARSADIHIMCGDLNYNVTRGYNLVCNVCPVLYNEVSKMCTLIAMHNIRTSQETDIHF